MVKKNASVTKKSTKTSKQEKHSPLFIVVVAIIAILATIVLGSWGVKEVISANNQARLDRIEEIYSTLQLNPDEYQVTNVNVFGEKRVYEWDAQRSYSSEINYVKGDTVTNTFNALDAKIREAGYEFIDEPYAGSVFKQFHYKSDKGEYIRLTVSSKIHDDAIRNSAIMNESMDSLADTDPAILDKGPANVTIKVNLDDNNE